MRRCALIALLALTAACEKDQLEAVASAVQIDRQTLDFGAVPEGTVEVESVTLTNPAPVPAVVTILDVFGPQADQFEVASGELQVGAQGESTIDVRYTPVGPGVDDAAFQVTWEELEEPITVSLKGGPIAPCLRLTPDPVDFAPATSSTTARPVAVQNGCDSNLHVTDLAIDTDGNQDFTLRSVTPPAAVAPAEEFEIVIDYRRSGDSREGRLLVTSDDPDSPETILRLIPDPLRACQDRADNDDDGLVDFPDDPGCTSPTDDDESNPPECDNGTTEPCNTDVGECTFGTRTCANRVWGPCEGATNAAPEICDGLDNDCDTRTDEEITDTCMVNGCAGARACIEEGVGEWTDCLPTGGVMEMCNGMDDDCDGDVDEGVVRACMVNMCAGTEICVPGGMGEWTSCQVTTQAEICNGVDDDCNGPIDDGIADLSCGFGECLRTVAACNNGMDNTCTPGTPTMEVCNGRDDNCNQLVDDGLGTLSCGVGACARTAPACANGMNNTCTPGTPGTEICNGLDDDCDMTADNNIADLTCGVGECARTAPACANGMNNTCTPGTPGMEICNGLDDDCDMTPDNNIANLMCGIGECARTVPACAGGMDNTCTPGTPTMEICNGLDDDCNMVIDNGVCGGGCGLGIVGADPQEPNNSVGTSNPVVLGALGTRVFTYDVTYPVGDTDWFQFEFTPPASGMWATITAEVLCVSWAGAGCGGGAPTVGLEAWYFDLCQTPQLDGSHNGVASLATVSSNGQILPALLGFCAPQIFRVRSFPSTTVCAGEAINAEIRVTVTFQ